MDISSPSLQEIRDMDLVNYLASLGHEPHRIRGNDFWYHSPLRQERVPSFKVNRRMNRWYDFGLGQGGNLIDFAILHQDCSVGELLASFARPCDTSVMQKLKRQKQSFPADHKLEVSRNVSLRSDSLLDYLRQRRISVHIADLYCREIHYRIGDKQFFSIGFPNRSGGFELRNAFFKGSSSPKDISVFSGLSEKLLVFEGFMDFLTFRSLHPELDESRRSYLILNSLSLFHRARTYMESHRYVGLFLDRDAAGLHATQQALSLHVCYRDESELYKHFKDLNQWAMHMGKPFLHLPKNNKRSHDQ